MKNQLFALVGLGLLLATASASAQTVPLKANIPFNFIVNKAELPAGEYTVQSLGFLRPYSSGAWTARSPRWFCRTPAHRQQPSDSEQAGVPPLRLRVFPGPDLDGRIRSG